MPATESAEERLYGRIDILDGDDRSGLELPIRGAKAISIYCWTPPDILLEQVPADFALELVCATGIDGNRRFWPPNGYERFIRESFLGGLAVLDIVKNMDGEARRSYRNMFHVFQRVRSLQEHCRRQFKSVRDLTIARSGRESQGEADILPDDVGLDAQRVGVPWSPARLISDGRRAARDAGWTSPTTKVAIQYGLDAAARRNPLRLRQAEVDNLVRLSLFDGGPSVERIELKTRRRITEQFLEVLDTHLGDDRETFNNWFTGPKNSLLQQIAKKACRGGEAISVDIVRRVLLDLGWESYRYMTDCMLAQMNWFARSLPEPLTNSERPMFEMLYYPQRHFAKLPLILLAERIPILSIPLQRMMERQPRTNDIQVLHRLLTFYTVMAMNRREADRRAQRQSRHRKDHGGAMVELDLFGDDLEVEEGDSGIARGYVGKRH